MHQGRYLSAATRVYFTSVVGHSFVCDGWYKRCAIFIGPLSPAYGEDFFVGL